MSRHWERPITIVAVLLVAAQLALAFIVRQPWVTGDTPVYVGLAEGLRHGHYGLATGGYAPDVLRPPGYPLILAAFGALGLGAPIVIAVQLTVYAACLVLLARVARIGLIPPALVLAIAAAYPFGALYVAALGVEGWLMPIVVILAVLLARDAQSLWTSITAGLLSGFAILLRSDMLLLPLVAAGAVLVLPFRGHTLGARARDALIVLVAAALIVLPYGLWNRAHFNRFQVSPIAAAVGSSLYTASWQQFVSHEDITSVYVGNPSPRAIESGLVAEIETTNVALGAPPRTAPFNPVAYPTREQQIAANAAFGRLALDRIAEHPVAYARHVASNLWWLWNTREYPAVPWLVTNGLALIAALTTILGYVGFLIGLANFRANPGLARVALLALYPLVVHLPLHTEARYTAASRPLLILFAALALVVLARQWKRQPRIEVE